MKACQSLSSRNYKAEVTNLVLLFCYSEVCKSKVFTNLFSLLLSVSNKITAQSYKEERFFPFKISKSSINCIQAPDACL